MKKIILIISIILATLNLSFSQTVYYVDGSVGTSGAGTSWGTAFKTIQEGIDAAYSSLTTPSTQTAQVWVKQGTYYIYVSSTDNTVSMKEGVQIYGGFAGTETLLTQRNYISNVTTISGRQSSGSSNQVKHVVSALGTTTSWTNGLIDGFTITEGKITGGSGGGGSSTDPTTILASGNSSAGAGVLIFKSAPSIANCKITSNYALKGGGMYIVSAVSWPASSVPQASIVNCEISDNTGVKRGGGVSIDVASNPIFERCKFINNTCSAKGGGVYIDWGCSQPVFINCLFAENSAFSAGGIGADGSSSPLLINCTITNNTSTDVGAGFYTGSYNPDTSTANEPILVNCIVNGNTATWGGPVDLRIWHDDYFYASHCILGTGFTSFGEGISTSSPSFTNTANHDYSLVYSSEGRNSAVTTDALVPSGYSIPTNDINGNTRDGSPDMGCYEYHVGSTASVTTQAVTSISTTTATGNGNITSLGSPSPTAYGLCWNTSGTPTTSDSKVDNGAASATGAFTVSMTGLSSSTTYHVRAYATNTVGTSYGDDLTFTTITPGTFTGNISSEWNTSGNWGGNTIPTSGTDVTIPSGKTVIIGPTTTADCNNLTVTGSLTIQSSALGTGSLIVNGTSTGTVTAERYLTGSKWHIVSPIAATQTVAAFLTANSNIPTASTNRGMMDYNTALNNWNSYYPTSGATGTMDAAKGYSTRITADGVVTFSGTLTSGTKSVTLSKVSSADWNCVGNPYSSAININTTAHANNNFISQNSAILDASYACLYVWDEDASYSGQNCYKVICNSGFTLPGKTNLSQNYIAPGQGFFVKTAANNNTMQFTAAMKSHQATEALKSANVSWPGFQLTTTTAQSRASTVISFNNAMTTGLDVTYDAGLLRGTSGLELYSRLVDDNGVGFAIQCLPESYNSLVIPLGVESKTGGEITFSAETVELPAACSVILEDKLAKTLTSLAGGASYKTTVSAGTTAVGRFYIHTNSSTTGTSELSTEVFSLKACPANGQIWIIGEVARGAKASLFDINGRNLGTFNLQEGSRNSISSAGLAPGVYLLNVTEASKRFNTKIVIY